MDIRRLGDDLSPCDQVMETALLLTEDEESFNHTKAPPNTGMSDNNQNGR